MPTTLLVKGIWPRITKLCKSGRAYVAVAYLGKSGRKLLPLCAGSVLVVDASEGAVKQGQTNPAELMKFVRAGVDVHSAADLHAKVFAFPEAVQIGSTNVSQNSAKHWQEAASLSTDRRVIKAAREFVLDLAGEATRSGRGARRWGRSGRRRAGSRRWRALAPRTRCSRTGGGRPLR